MDQQTLIPHLFRTEYRKIVSVLYRHFGFDEMATAEDLASETFLTAAQTWGIHGPPANPIAWLYQVAKNKAVNHLQRQHTFDSKVAPGLRATSSPDYDVIDLSPQNILDSQLQMMFTICHPSIPPEAQIGLSLRILCGFGIDEIAHAFLTNRETINKRLYRAREKLRAEKIAIELPPDGDIDARLNTVLNTIYLLFNEGYYSSGEHHPLRKELCFEAMRLCTMLVEQERTNRPAVNALLALMCFHASRFDARTTGSGELVLYDDQDTDRWNTDLIAKGGYFLHQATSGDTLTRYHLEAGIAYWNTQPAGTAGKWDHILQLYDRLLQIAYTPMAALNRLFAVSKVRGKQAAIAEAEKLSFHNHLFYFLLLGDLYNGIDTQRSTTYLHQALALARTEAEEQAIRKKIDKT